MNIKVLVICVGLFFIACEEKKAGIYNIDINTTEVELVENHYVSSNSDWKASKDYFLEFKGGYSCVTFCDGQLTFHRVVLDSVGIENFKLGKISKDSTIVIEGHFYRVDLVRLKKNKKKFLFFEQKL